MIVTPSEEIPLSNSSLPYRLRPNKAVDRELFLSLLSWLSPELSLRDYAYVGMGAEFLEDFRMLHARIGITNMVSVECDEEVFKRQEFNKPLESITCVQNTIEEYLKKTTFENPTIFWLDYTSPSELREQIEMFLTLADDCQIGSILRITLNANSACLGNPAPGETSIKLDSSEHSPGTPLHNWRRLKFKDQLGPLYKKSVDASYMTAKKFGEGILEILRLSVDKEFKHSKTKEIIWTLSTHYADGQPMVTATAIITKKDDARLKELVEKWEFYSTPECPLKLDLPALSTKERIYLESNATTGGDMDYRIPKGKLGQEPLECFQKFYRVFPHFTRVDL